MTINEAIAYSEQLNPLFKTWLHRDFEKAHKLGIEAMKHLQDIRGVDTTRPITLLPGETKQ